MADPYAATSAQIRALHDVADAAKTAFGFLGGFFKRGSHRKEALLSIKKLGDALNRLDATSGADLADDDFHPTHDEQCFAERLVELRRDMRRALAVLQGERDDDAVLGGKAIGVLEEALERDEVWAAEDAYDEEHAADGEGATMPSKCPSKGAT